MFWERCQSGPLGGSGWRCLLRTSWNPDEAGMFRSESDLQSAQRDTCLPRPPLQDKRRQGVTSLFLLGLVQVQSFQNVHVEKIHRSYPVSQFTDRETEVQKRGLIDPKSHRIRSAYRTPIQVSSSCYFCDSSVTLSASQVVLMGQNLTANAGGMRLKGSVPGLGRSPGGRNGNPLQYPCLENPMDRRAWWAIVHRVANNQTQLK